LIKFNREIKGYLITQEQLEKIEHYKRMFEVNAEIVHGLCSEEKDDIVFGFELGKIQTHLIQCFIGMMELENEIRSQPSNTKEK
jgi:hypothetical protein